MTKLFERFLIFSDLDNLTENKNHEMVLLYSFPTQTNQKIVKKYVPFCFSDYDVNTTDPMTKWESFTFVGTNEMGERSYSICKRIVSGPLLVRECMMFESALPLFSLFYRLLDLLEMQREISIQLVQDFLTDLYLKAVPLKGQAININLENRTLENLNKVKVSKEFKLYLQSKVIIKPFKNMNNTQKEEQNLITVNKNNNNENEKEKEKENQKENEQEKENKKENESEKEKETEKEQEQESKNENESEQEKEKENEKENENEKEKEEEKEEEEEEIEKLIQINYQKMNLPRRFSIIRPLADIGVEIIGKLLVTFKPQQIVKIFSSLILERKVVMFSRKIGYLSNVIQSFVSFLSPFTWHHILIPITPRSIMKAILAPMPYFLGMTSKFYNQIPNKTLEKIIWIDLDRGILNDPEKAINYLPSKPTNSLINKLKKYTEIYKNRKLSSAGPIFELFLEFWSKILDQYDQCVLFDRRTGQCSFNLEGFASNRSKSFKKFIGQFKKTQMWEFWVDNRLESIRQGDTIRPVGEFELKRIERSKSTLNKSTKHFISALLKKNKANKKQISITNISKELESINNFHLNKLGNNDDDNENQMKNENDNKTNINGNNQNGGGNGNEKTENNNKNENENENENENNQIIINNSDGGGKNGNFNITDTFETILKQMQNQGDRWKHLSDIISAELRMENNLKKIMVHFAIPSQDKNLIPEESWKMIFRNVKSLYEMQKQLIEELNTRKKSLIELGKIGDIYIKMAPFFQIYSTYISSYEIIQNTLNDVMKTQKFHNFVLAKQNESKSDLMSCLILPMIHFRKYPEMFSQLIGYTLETHQDYNSLLQVKKNFEQLNVLVNQKLNNLDNLTKVVEIQKLFKNQLNLAVPTRRFVYEGELMKIIGQKPVKRKFVLFNDILIYGSINQKNASSPQVLELFQIVIQEIKNSNISGNNDEYNNNDNGNENDNENENENNNNNNNNNNSNDNDNNNNEEIEKEKQDKINYQNSFEIKTPKEIFTVITESIEIKKKWMEILNKQINEAISTKQRFQKGGNQIKTKKSKVETCTFCNKKFNKFRRRRDCKNCERVFCKKCCNNKIVIGSESNSPSRVCGECFKSLSLND
ncbi:receptor mediated endocytosis [Anaeramoeba flamelloides]|uniref:Receptor mediated endocytosis n=1 Tax=Anaeramoeba flamelloides TaxID=1746091 RepID=A0AAV8A2Z0_9EUKA|nr:receptor mediated endocytosis [Anaeramoeba flamelloides]